MNDLRTIVSSALLGTERSPLGQLQNHHLEQTRQQLEKQGQARQLLGTAMLALNLTRAGQMANGKLPFATPATKDVRAEIPQAARERLQQLLAQHTDLIPEWLELANQAGFRVPHQDVIALLDYGRQHLEQRQKILPLLDSRGRWLAQQNPQWAWAMGDTSNLNNALETWEIGSKAARVLALQTIRQHNPEQARGLLETVWKSEPADERKSFLSELENRLSEADEPFLESCLDDRSKEVRSIAAGLLSKLPESALIKRMTARAADLLNLGKKEIAVTLPEWQDGFSRDAIEKKPPYGQQGEKAYWLEQIICHVPCTFWETHLQLEPTDILKRLPKEWRLNFTNAFLAANQKNPNPTWSQALLEFDSKWMANVALMNTLPLEQREQRVRQVVFGKNAWNTEWLAWMDFSWSLEFSRNALEWLGDLGHETLKGKTNHYVYLGMLALHCHIDVVKTWSSYPKWTTYLQAYANRQVSQDNRAWHIVHFADQIKSLISTLETRATMRIELKS